MALPKVPTAPQIQKAALAKASAQSPYYYGGGGFQPPKPVRSPYYYGAGEPTRTAGSIGPTGGGGGGGGGAPPPVTQNRPQMPSWQDYVTQGEEPDWNALINANFLTQQAESQAGPLRAQADVGLKQGIASALYQYGWDPAKMTLQSLGAATPYLTQADVDAAQGNQYSALSTIARNQDLAQRAAEANLASRGILSSGQLASDTENIASQAGGQRNTAYENLMNLVGQGINKRADVESQIAQRLQDARAQAAQFVASNYQPPVTNFFPGDYISDLVNWATSQQTPQTYVAPPPVAPPPVAPAKVPAGGWIGGPGGPGTTTGRITPKRR